MGRACGSDVGFRAKRLKAAEGPKGMSVVRPSGRAGSAVRLGSSRTRRLRGKRSGSISGLHAAWQVVDAVNRSQPRTTGPRMEGESRPRTCGPGQRAGQFSTEDLWSKAEGGAVGLELEPLRCGRRAATAAQKCC